jgi:hypothetical protein
MQPVASIGIIFVSVSICSLLAIGSIAVIALGSSGVFTPSERSATTTTPISNTLASISTMAESLLNDASIYPRGSYSAALSSFTKASDTLALIPLTQAALNVSGPIDNSSAIIEAGRAQYLYFQLPKGALDASNSTVRQNTNRIKSAIARAKLTITGIAIHFGVAESGNTITVVPLTNIGSTNNQLLTGVVQHKLTDGSIVVRIELSVPTSVCPFSNGQPIDACLTIAYQAYSIVNSNQITTALSFDVRMACGDVCSLPSDLCSTSCTTCDGQQVAGYDTPVTRRYNMGSPVGTFQFDYDTYFVQDQITVWNAGILLFSTGCVGAFDTIYLNYSSHSSTIRVDVEPNCNCTNPTGCGTAWDFTAHCLNSSTRIQKGTKNNQNIGINIISSTRSDKAAIENYLYANQK